MRTLIVKFSSIGDCVMAVPVVAAIRDQRPDDFIGWAIDPRCRPVVHEPLLDLIHDIPWEAWKRERTSSLAQLRHYMKLREYRFDVGLDLQGHAKTAICLRFSGARKRWHVRSFDPLCRLLSRRVPDGGAVHTVDRNLEALAVLGLDRPQPPRFPMPPMRPVSSAEPLVTIAVGTGHPKKNYGRWAEVGEGLQRAGVEVVYVGGPDESAPPSGGRSLVGELSLAETMALIASSQVHIAADTGSGHIAAAYEVPVVSVFGWTDSALFRPYSKGTVVLDAGPQMDAIAPEEVVATALNAL